MPLSEKVQKLPCGSGLNPSGEPATGQLHIPTEQPCMSQVNFNAHAASGGVPTPISSGSMSLYGWSMQDADFDSHFPHGQYHGALFSEGLQGSSFEPLPQGSSHNFPSTAPLQGTGTSMSALEMTLIQRVEDSTSQSATLSMPQPTRIKLSDDIIDQSMKMAMQLFTHELFGEKAMAVDKAAKKIMLIKVTWDLVPHCFAPNATFEDFISNKHCKDVANALSSTHGKFAELVHKGVFHAFDQVEIKAKFQNSFIMSIIHFVWHGLHQEFLSKTEEQQIKNLKFMWVLAGAVTFGSLNEQFEVQVKVDGFGGMGSNRKFLYILSAMNNLSRDE
ncbi:uncharacterized protein HD556DRAFT_1304892 [Suillus plorans]|uniref:Uncharacterized protein n=1 Tax=Suillus plorans TaxID=116603 RepID=A0A9P7DQV8_9AGAM|nr:uncharacterized protein HD556DRAFT_1304892 [Suillus plorans]KAG1800909.1 hypothetical protein HD556DRAFT_1304892 [Suillus plorans]